MLKHRHFLALALVPIVLTLTGCGKKPPELTDVEGIVYLNDQPLPFAQVEFMPELSNFGAEYNSMAVTDAKGVFKLHCNIGQPGAAIATHRVVVIEGPPPAELRGMDGASQTKLAQYMNSLTNRPIPEIYANYSQTPLRVEVKPEQKTYQIRMSR
jgi:hypothetical protein